MDCAFYLTVVDILDFSNIITNMTIGKKLPTRNAFRASNQIQFDDDGRGYMLERELPRDSTGMKRYLPLVFLRMVLILTVMQFCCSQKRPYRSLT